MSTEKLFIDANAFWESVNTDYWEHFTRCHTTDQIDLMEMIEYNLAEQPTVDAVEVVHGRWNWQKDGEADYEQYWMCSECKDVTFFKTNYCSNCGAKMDGGK